MRLIDDGNPIDTDDCCPELGRTHFEDDHMQVSDEPSVANVLISQADFERAVEAVEARKLIAFLDDPKSMPELTFHVHSDGSEYHACTYRDPFSGRGGVEYGDTPSDAIKAALRTIKYYRTQGEPKVAA